MEEDDDEKESCNMKVWNLKMEEVDDRRHKGERWGNEKREAN